jgi:snapalysin
MLKRALIGLIAGVALVLPLAGVTATQAAAAEDPGVLVVTLTYDDSRAAEFRSAVTQGVSIWNSAAPNVRIVRAPAGTRANITVIADNGWPRAQLGPVRPGRFVTVWMGRQAVQQGYNVVRIAAHELGHSLGLPDRRTGLCSDLMSGSSAPVSCRNAQPSSAERAAVQRNYANGLSAQQAPGQAVLVVDAAA